MLGGRALICSLTDSGARAVPLAGGMGDGDRPVVAAGHLHRFSARTQFLINLSLNPEPQPPDLLLGGISPLKLRRTSPTAGSTHSR